MKKIIFALFFLFFVAVFILGCGKKTCESRLYTNDEKCCTYVCNIGCPDEYKKGTCNCECEEVPVTGEAGDTNIGDIFDDSTDIEPPSIPS